MVNPLVGHVSWAVPDNHAISVTLFKDPRTHELEDKDWTFVVEDVSSGLYWLVVYCNFASGEFWGKWLQSAFYCYLIYVRKH